MYTCKVNKCYENKRLYYYILYNYYYKYFVGKIVYTFLIQNLNFGNQKYFFLLNYFLCSKTYFKLQVEKDCAHQLQKKT